MVNQYLYHKISDITTKVYPDFIPIGVEYPAVMIELLNSQPEHYKGGTDVSSQFWAVHIVSPTVSARNDLATEIRKKLEYASDPSYYVKDCILYDEMTGFDKDVEMFIKVLTFEFRVEMPSSVLVAWDFEGTLTVGEFEGEGEIMEYGYRSGWGDDYGSIADFYTYYEYAGIYWTEGELYVWGVNVERLEIDDEVYYGTYENGYTVFNIKENPFDGATAEIKIKGTPTEVWDYEGVMTVGNMSESTGYGWEFGNEFGDMNPASLIPGIYYKLTGELNVLSVCRKIKIGDLLFTSINWLTLFPEGIYTYFDDCFRNPFPDEGEEVTIKVLV